MKTLLFSLLLATTTTLSAQLPRIAQLGAALKSLSDSETTSGHTPDQTGVLVNYVMEGSSAQSLGLQANDIILSLNGKEKSHPDQIIQALSQMHAGDEIEIEFLREGDRLQTRGALQGKPKETSDYAEVIYDAVPFDGGYVRTIIHKPLGKEKAPAVFFIQGFGCFSLDGMTDHPYQRVVNGLAQKGYVVIKTEKAGAGDSQNNRNCEDYDLFEEIELFSASYNALKKYDFIDQENIFIFGHSMGGIQAPLMQTSIAPKGIAVFGTAIRPWFYYFTEQAQMQKIIMGQDFLELEARQEPSIKFYYQLMVEKRPLKEIIQDPDLKEFMTQSFRFDGHNRLSGRHYRFWQQLQDTQLFTAWAQTPAHVLSIWGEGEFIAFNPWEHQLIADVVNRYNPGKARYIRIPNMNHAFVWVKNQEHAVQVHSDREYMLNNFNDAIIQELHFWIQEVIAL